MIRIGIAGYGNLGRGVELSIKQNPDMDLAAIFTRRAAGEVKPKDPSVRVLHISEAEKMKFANRTRYFGRY